ncbi:MAG: 16S rRNA (uracil(1498)-N(3))-methyltransferase [Cocleimonas sp.]
MKIPRFYQNDNLEEYSSSGEALTLSAVNHRHAIQVLRLKVEEKLILFNGSGGEYFAHIHTFDKRKSSVILDSFNAINRESPLSITLNLAMIKPDKMDLAIQKAVELGVNTIQPMYNERSIIKIKVNRLAKKMDHWQGIIIGACEQSGRTMLPILKQPISLEYCIDNELKSSFNVAMLPNAVDRLADLKDLEKDQSVSLFIGPEGGFTDNEEQMMLDTGVSTIKFGPRILRAETAVISGITAVQQRWGDL